MYEAIENVYQKIQSHIKQTPLVKSNVLSEKLNANVLLKCENLQVTNAFKVRGALNKLMSLTDEQRLKGVVTASTGNHGAAMAFAGKLLSVPVTIYVPESTVQVKLDNMRQYGAKIKVVGEQCGDSEAAARNDAEQHHVPYVSPYNDIDIIRGQGTISAELTRQIDRIDVIYVAIGGGGLISGIASYFDDHPSYPRPKIVGCLPKNSDVYYESVKQGKIVECDVKPTLADASAGNIDLDSITFDIGKDVIDDYVLISEKEISDAIRLIHENENMTIEGAAALSVAAAMKQQDQLTDKNVVLVLSGGNIDADKLKSIVSNVTPT